jgi:hypothetical protein
LEAVRVALAHLRRLAVKDKSARLVVEIYGKVAK